MLHLLQPIWLLLTAGIAVPVILHLWNRKPGRILKIGSIQLLKSATVRHARSLRISELLLLLLRCLLIILTALLLAHPLWENNFSREHRGWIILEDDAYPHFKKTIDSLVESGCDIHRFHTNFPRVNIRHLPSGDTSTIGYWQLLKELETLVPADFPLHVFSQATYNRFQGDKPSLHLRINWQVYTKDTTLTWNHYRYSISHDSSLQIKGHANAHGIWYASDRVGVSDSSNTTVIIYTDKYQQDAAFLLAGLQAVQQYTGSNLQIKSVRNLAEIDTMASWICWLSDNPVPAIRGGARILKYATGKEVPTDAVLGDIRLFKRIPYSQQNDSILQSDSYGSPVITTNGKVYTLYTHLHPEWTNLTWNGHFPELLLEALFPVPDAGIHDVRALDGKQLRTPAPTSGNTFKPVITTDLSDACWIMLFLIFALERFLALRSKKAPANG
ncbi:putative membrane protein (TIGR02226 family) [Chitinophaga dinghuensis]|uniref:Putative membrane protein (TIGR02226 family) n=1 Tax=Chitinophaga dinghuensis TaxID=1539050 RepID=A0A327VZW3_9BACT|nr:BatA domain-containing protein [Chitinophaga dinghuensis]RAJ82032.1 putative membrane protein (TIGR02226 family) [Chitinophaga dinghuensis]